MVELDGPRLYLDHPKGVGPPANLSWSALDSYWHNATEGYTDAQRANVLGAEVSMWMDNYCSYWECHMTHATPATPRMCAWYLSGAKAQQAETFSKSLFAVMFPKVFVAGGAFYRFNASASCRPASTDRCWSSVAAHATRVSARGGVAGCPLFAPPVAGGGLAANCSIGCTEAAFCGEEYPHVPTTDPVGNDPYGGGPCPYHY